jgi:ubiquitin-protein ligase
MQELTLVVRDKLSGREFDVEVGVDKRIAELAQAVRQELQLPDKDTRGPVVYKFVLARTGLLLDSGQTVGEAELRNQDVLTFWGEPTAAASSERLRREYADVLKRYDNHTAVSVVAQGHPPSQYVVTYTMKGPTENKGGKLVFGNRHVLRITIPEDYPRSKPSGAMETSVYHPNISVSGNVCIGNGFYTAESIADVIAKVGNYIQYREYSLRARDGVAVHRSDVESWILSQGGRVGPFDKVPLG